MGAKKPIEVKKVPSITEGENRFNNKALRSWLVINFPSCVFEYDRGNLPYYFFDGYLKTLNEEKES